VTTAVPRRLTLGDNPAVRVVGRIRARVQTKLLVAFVATVAVVVVVGLLGLRVLGQSNSRVEGLGNLQLRAAAYSQLQAEAATVRQLIGITSGGDDFTTYTSGTTQRRRPPQATLPALDVTIQAVLLYIGRDIHSLRLAGDRQRGQLGAGRRVRRRGGDRGGVRHAERVLPAPAGRGQVSAGVTSAQTPWVGNVRPFVLQSAFDERAVSEVVRRGEGRR
jgi:hypothetical protein